jgi:hypothetical protein
MSNGRALREERSAKLKEGRKSAGSYTTVPSYHTMFFDKGSAGPGAGKAAWEQMRRESKGMDAVPMDRKTIRVARSHELKRIRETATPERTTKRIYRKR